MRHRPTPTFFVAAVRAFAPLTALVVLAIVLAPCMGA